MRPPGPHFTKKDTEYEERRRCAWDEAAVVAELVFELRREAACWIGPLCRHGPGGRCLGVFLSSPDHQAFTCGSSIRPQWPESSCLMLGVSWGLLPRVMSPPSGFLGPSEFLSYSLRFVCILCPVGATIPANQGHLGAHRRCRAHRVRSRLWKEVCRGQFLARPQAACHPARGPCELRTPGWKVPRQSQQETCTGWHGRGPPDRGGQAICPLPRKLGRITKHREGRACR